RMPGGRARQMRLGIVDAFDLDRQRQLVIVRRDNVEHLVMIGGPNDVLVESGILRVPAGAVGQREAPPLVPVEPPVARTSPPQPVATAAPRPAQPATRATEAPPVQPVTRAPVQAPA